MKKKDIIKAVSQKANCTQKQAEEVYNALVEVVEDGIMEGKSFKVLDFIKVSTKELKARTGKLTNRDGEVIYWERDAKDVPTVKLTDVIMKKFK